MPKKILQLTPKIIFLIIIPILVGVLAIIISGAISGYNPILSGTASVQIVDVNIIESHEYPIIEIKLRNTGKQTAFLKRAQFKIRNFWHIPECGYPDAVPVSWTYDIKLSDAKDQQFTISQAIEPDSVDRFQFRMATDSIYPVNGLYLYLIDLSLIYNENDEIITVPPIFINVHPRDTLLGFTYVGHSEDCFKENKNTAQNVFSTINPIKNLIVKKETLEAVNSWASFPGYSEYYSSDYSKELTIVLYTPY